MPNVALKLAPFGRRMDVFFDGKLEVKKFLSFSPKPKPKPKPKPMTGAVTRTSCSFLHFWNTPKSTL